MKINFSQKANICSEQINTKVVMTSSHAMKIIGKTITLNEGTQDNNLGKQTTLHNKHQTKSVVVTVKQLKIKMKETPKYQNPESNSNCLQIGIK